MLIHLCITHAFKNKTNHTRAHTHARTHNRLQMPFPRRTLFIYLLQKDLQGKVNLFHDLFIYDVAKFTLRFLQ